ncbi:universal stress protein [Malaciobacter pacificus]|uniref:Universal stress protein n=1 Tax=Malaciobacter pacificus TaxID=1080223 RepID=A0A5C2HCW8_9BACT|nr:universal stress protein [Malaciobacter pacificus]QEP35415.1 universal stress protein [Malaciobacter pacificus]GGD38860.1 universal stress protein [Malaciobacter pacificus]
MSYVLCCVDGGKYTQAIMDYAVMISNNMNLPLRLLNVVEHNHNAKQVDMSGNIGFGAKEDILEKLVNEEAKESKCAISAGKELLKSLKEQIKSQCTNEVVTSQVHGDIIENIVEFEEDTAILIIGLNSHDKELVGDNVKDIIKSIHKPVLLVNNDFVEPKKLLVAYNGSNESKKLLQATSSKPIFKKEVSRTIINLSKHESSSRELLNEAKNIYAQNGIEVDTYGARGESPVLITDYFEKEKFDVLCMGAFGHSWIKQLVLGSFTEKVLSKMKKPILLYR